MDVITIPYRNFPMYGGAIHCSTWDIRRDEDLVDYFPNQDYGAELKVNLDVIPDKTLADREKYHYKEQKFNDVVEKLF